MYNFGLIDRIIPEPMGGAHWDYNEAAAKLKPHIIETIKELQQMDPQERIEKRIEKFGVMGFWDEVEEPKHEPVTEENNQQA
jgi:acetyl-CoA carboxylase carboxyl transferase subunit alpha